MLNIIGRTLVALPLAALILASAPVRAEEQSKPTAFEPSEEQAIREIVRQYLLDHPEVLIESLQAFQEREKLAAEARQRDALKRHMTALTQDPDDPVLGNPDGDVTIVEFFDYRCPYCKRVAEGLRQTVEEDGKIRLVMKEYPILGPDSQGRARCRPAEARHGVRRDRRYARKEHSHGPKPEHHRHAGLRDRRADRAWRTRHAHPTEPDRRGAGRLELSREIGFSQSGSERQGGASRDSDCTRGARCVNA
jgi:hypothetical protein